jgi:Ran GTPase-activating protein (RanGAP) involved in mRNA processing and transport
MLIESQYVNGICLKNNFLKNEGVIKIFSSVISKNSHIICLDISETKIDEKAMKFISENVKKSVILQKLILANNNFKKAGTFIQKLLSQESNLKYLSLAYCEINNQFNLIFDGLKKNKSIKTIDISGNNIPMKHDLLKLLTNILNDNHYLTQLIMDDCNIDDIGMNFINKGLENNHTLKTLSLNNNYLTLKAIPGLSNAIEKSKIIKKIYLEENGGLNAKYINEIEQKLYQNEKNFIPIN